MADEDITLDGKPLQSLRVADLKAALEQRNLPKSGQKNTLLKRLKGALMLENLQRSSSSHSGLQPNSQIGEEMCQNSFIKQYLAQQQELLRQRLAREAQQGEEADESPAGPEEDEEQSEDNDSPPFVSKQKGPRTQPPGPDVGGENSGPAAASRHRESSDAPRARIQRAPFQQGHREPPASSPPRAVASFSVRVQGQPDSHGYPAPLPPGQEKEAATVSVPRAAHPGLNLSRSARSSAENHVKDDSDEDDDSDDSDEDEDWGPGPGGARRRKAAVPSKQQVAPSVSSAAARSKRKLQPPQHIPPPQVHDTPMQLRHPTPPPSPPPNLFPLPDTPKQSPPDDQEREAARDAGMASFPPPTMQRQDSDSSSGSSSPEPPVKRRSGPLSLLMHKMESEEATSSPGFSGETAHSTATCSSESPLQPSETKMQQEVRESEEERPLKEEKERGQQQKPERESIKSQEQEREKSRSEEEQERKGLEEVRKQRQKEEQEKEKRRQEEEKEKKRKEEERRIAEQRLREEEEKKRETAKSDQRAAARGEDSGSSSDSDSKSESSSRSSSSSSSSSPARETPQPASQLKRADQRQEAEAHEKTKFSNDSENPNLSKREVSEPSTAAVTEVEADSESPVAQQPASGAEPESSESRMEESTTPKAFAARKISLSSSKASPASTDGGAGESETGGAAGRKRRWGSSTAVTVKKPSISITTDSLKSLIPDIKVNQEAVVDLHPEELQMSGDEENSDTGRSDPDKGLKIRRTVTQVVPSENQENGQTSVEEDAEKSEGEKQDKPTRERKRSSVSEEAPETQISVSLDGEAKKVTPSDSLVRRSISQQKSGVSVTIDDPVRTTRQPSPPRGKVSNIIHVINLVRPFTLLQLKELLNRTGSVVEEGFWIDKIKSHCYVTYATTEEAVATRTALHGVKWPPSNPKVLGVDFCQQDELDYHKGIRKPEKEPEQAAPVAPPPLPRLPPLMPVRDRDKEQEQREQRERERDRGVRDLWAERQREMERRERARGEREWDRDKVREFARPGEEGRRSRSRERERRRRERAKSKEKKTDKKEKGDEPPAKLLDDLFLKTKAAPCIYWLPLTEEQANQRLLDTVERQKERERRRKEQQEEEEKKRDEEKKERLKVREKEAGGAAAAAASAAASGRGGDADRERDRGRDREANKRRDSSHRSRRPSLVSGGGRRSLSRSNPRDRRR